MRVIVVVVALRSRVRTLAQGVAAQLPGKLLLEDNPGGPTSAPLDTAASPPFWTWFIRNPRALDCAQPIGRSGRI